MAQSEEELKSLLMKVKRGEWKPGLKLSIQKTKIMASIPSLHGNRLGKQWKQWQTYFLGLQNNCRHEIKRCLFLGRKTMTYPDSILKNRDITFPTKVHIVKAMVFPVVVYGCESWTVKKAECWRIDAFELWCWRRLLRVPCTARKSNHSILKEINPWYSLGVLILKLKLQYFGHLIQRANSLEKVLMQGKTEGRRRSRPQMMR